MFFGIAGGLTAVGPTVGGYLTAWTWRSIFWINIPVAIIALVLIAVASRATSAAARPASTSRPRPDHRGCRAQRVRLAAERGLGLDEPAHRRDRSRSLRRYSWRSCSSNSGQLLP